MANLLQVTGIGYGVETAAITVTADGVEIFNGVIPTSATNPDLPPGTYPVPAEFTQVLFNVDYGTGASSEKQISITANTGSLMLFYEFQNHYLMPNPVFTPEEFAILIDPNSTVATKAQIRFDKANPPFTAEEQAVYLDPATTGQVRGAMAVEHNVGTYVDSGETNFQQITGETRINVNIDGIPQEPVRRPGQDGTWYWVVPQGSTITYLNVIPQFYGATVS